MDDWGELILKQIDSSEFWYLIDELCDDDSDFLNNRTYILEAYKNGNLYGLKVAETDKMYERGAKTDILFCKGSWYLLPCFCCIEDDNTAVILWTHSRARNLGFAKKLVELLHIKYAHNLLPKSIEFWNKCKVKNSNTKK